MAFTTDRVLLASAARSGSGGGTAVDLGIHTTLEALLDVTVASGSLVVTIETSRDGSTGWAEVLPVDAEGNEVVFAAKTTVGSEWVIFPGCSRYVRARWAITGAGHTFSVAGPSVLVYATPQDVADMALRAEWLAGVSSAKIDKAARGSTGEINSALGQQFGLPPTAFGDDIRRCCAVLAACDLIVSEGVKPQDVDQILFDRCKGSRAWLELVAEGDRTPEGFEDATPDVDDAGAHMVSDQLRGW